MMNELRQTCSRIAALLLMLSFTAAGAHAQDGAWSFEDQALGDWTILTDLGNNYSTSGEVTDERAADGTYAVRLTVGDDATNGALANDNLVLAPGDTIRYRLWFAADQAAAINGIQPFLQHGDSWAWVDLWHGAADLTADAWNTITLVVPDDAGAMQRVGLQITGTDEASMATVFVDHITINETSGGDSGAMTIAEARAAGAGETVTIEGVVTRSRGAFTYLQDATGGLTIRQTSGDFFEGVTDGTIQTGTEVRVTGALSEFASLLQINADDMASYEVLGTTAAPAPQTITLEELAQNGEAYEAELVRVTELEMAETGAFSPGTSYDVTDATGSAVLRIPNADDTEVDGLDMPEEAFTFTGVIGQFDYDDPAAGYQLLAISEGDVAAGTDAGSASFETGFESLEGLNSWVNTSSDPGLTLSLSSDAAEGASALEFAFDFVADQSWGGSVDIQREAAGGTFGDLSEREGLRLRYKVIDPISNTAGVAFAIKLGDFSSGAVVERWEYRTTEVITDESGEWQVLEVPFAAFTLPSWVDQGNAELDLDAITLWEMQVVVGDGGVGGTYTGTILLDDVGLYGGVDTAVEDALPASLALRQNYPNPFNPSTTIEYVLAARSDVRLSVYNALGQRVATLVDGAQPAGTYTAHFDARDLASGVYVYRLEAGGAVQTRRMMLVK